jgi:hypothetical protein
MARAWHGGRRERHNRTSERYALLARHQLTLAIAVGYGPAPMVTPVVDALVRELRRADITLHDSLRVENGRYWS